MIEKGPSERYVVPLCDERVCAEDSCVPLRKVYCAYTLIAEDENLCSIHTRPWSKICRLFSIWTLFSLLRNEKMAFVKISLASPLKK